jgi:two-component system, NarL family, response regulator NreC
MKKLRILFADDQMMICDAMVNLFVNEPDITVVAVAYQWDKAISLVKEKEPDVAIVALKLLLKNVSLSNFNVATEFTGCRLITLAENSDRKHVVNIFKSGIMGCVFKESPSSELIRAVRSVAGNCRYLDPSVNDVSISEDISIPSSDNLLNRHQLLTQREKEVLRLTAEGKNNHDISMELGISVKTLEAHRRHILKKLKLRNSAELTRYAIKEGISQLE